MAGPNRGMPATHRYTQADLRPTLLDPRCDPKFPLANYWPVYLGNFWCDPYTQHTVRIQEYFGSKGLLVRMVFGRNEACDPYFKEQSKSKCYDFLIYFVAQQDANDAVYFCNRDLYYGHRLNVLPGRMPVFFDLSRSVKHSLIQPGRLEMCEQVFERHIYNICRARTAFIIKHNKEDLLTEYCSTDDRTKAIQYCKVAAPNLISMNKPKQRFLERDVQSEIVVWIRGHPSVMDSLPPGNILQALCNGLLPHNVMSWKTMDMVPRIRKIRAFGSGKKRRELRDPVYEQAWRLFGIEPDKVNIYSEDVRAFRHEQKLERIRQRH